MENQKFIKVIKNNNSEVYLNINHISTFYTSNDSELTVLNFKDGKRMFIKEQVDVFADRISM